MRAVILSAILVTVSGCQPESQWMNYTPPDMTSTSMTATINFTEPALNRTFSSGVITLFSAPTSARFEGEIVSGEFQFGFSYGDPQSEPWHPRLWILPDSHSYDCLDGTVDPNNPVPLDRGIFRGTESYDFTTGSATLTFSGNCLSPVSGSVTIVHYQNPAPGSDMN